MHRQLALASLIGLTLICSISSGQGLARQIEGTWRVDIDATRDSLKGIISEEEAEIALQFMREMRISFGEDGTLDVKMEAIQLRGTFEVLEIDEQEKSLRISARQELGGDEENESTVVFIDRDTMKILDDNVDQVVIMVRVKEDDHDDDQVDDRVDDQVDDRDDD